MKIKLIDIEKVFTPSSPAELTYVSRVDSEKQFRRALKTIGKQIIVFGHSGCGKSTMIVNILNELNIKHITTRCTKGLTIESLIFDAFNQLDCYYSVEKDIQSDTITGGEGKINSGIFSFLFNISNRESEKDIRKRIVEIQKNPHQLAKIFGEAKCLWVIEDFHKLDNDPKKELSQIMKVFMDVSHSFPILKIIAIGAVDSARDVVHYDSEMNNRISEVFVPLMNIQEINSIITQGERLLNIAIEEEVIERVVAYSSGLASVTHQLCYLLCESIGISQTSINLKSIKADDLDYAINEFVNEKSDTLKSVYELAMKDKSVRKNDSSLNILTAILKVHKESFNINDIAIEMRVLIPKYNSKNLRKYVMELTQAEKGEILRFNRNADTFTFSNPFVRGYCYIHLIKYKQKRSDQLHLEYRNLEVIENQLLDEYKQFIRDFNEDLIFDD